MKRRSWEIVVGCALGLSLAACRSPLPVYDWQNADRARGIMAERSRSLGDISAACQVALTDAEGKTVTLEGEIVARGETHLRLRARKFNQAVFDLTLNPDGLFIWSTDQGPAAKEGDKIQFTAAHLAHAWSLMSGGLFAQPPARLLDEGGKEFEAQYPVDSSLITAYVDRKTLTVRRYVVAVEEKIVQTLWLDEYRLIEKIAWPMKITAQGEQGRVVIHLRDVEPHADLPSGAFTPPKRAVKQP